jgi:hypothetical protein
VCYTVRKERMLWHSRKKSWKKRKVKSDGFPHTNERMFRFEK